MVVVACQQDLASHPVPPWPCASCIQDAFAQVERTWVWTWGALCTTWGKLQDAPLAVVATPEGILQDHASPVVEEHP